ncbi:hypothetical protein BH11PSE11_BH11PSE11_19180 [soil metagenome]
MSSAPRTYADVDGFVTLLQVACEDKSVNDTLQHLLSQPAPARHAALLKLLDKLRAEGAYPQLIDAMACLLDDAVADKAYCMICERRS